ncbi:MAG: 4Fe-4S binding protein [Pyrobaculum sp.]
MVRRDRPSVVVVRGRARLSDLLAETPLYFAYRGPHEGWFRDVAERHVDEARWELLPAAEARTATRRDLLRGGFIRLRDTVVVRQDRCIWCGLCANACPYSAVEYVEGRRVSVNYERCVDCGLCNSVCPVDAVQMPSLPDGYLAELVKTAPSPLRFICDYAFEDGDEEGVRVRCIAAVPRQYMYIAASKHGEARAHCSRGERCPLWKAAEVWAAGLEKEGGDFVVKAQKAKLDPGDRWQTRMLAAAVGMPTGHIEVAEGCTLCGACVNVCPTDALAITNYELKITPALCIACGLCAEKCPEKVIKIVQKRDPSPYERRVVFKDSPARCVSCGRELPYTETMARKLAERLREKGLPHDHVYLCDDCRLKQL